MLIVCAWCKKEIGQKEPVDDSSETHGMCLSCEEAFEMDIKTFIEGRHDALGL